MIKTDTLIELKDAHVNFGGVKALDGASVSIDEGQVVVLMGPNGAGKSTVLKAMFGLVPLEKGNVWWHGEEIKPQPHDMVWKGVTFVTQGRRVFPSLTVKENLEIGGWFLPEKRQREERLREVLDLFPMLKTRLDQKSGTLSGGQQQMVAIARGMMADPKVLMLDEPSLGLAPKIVKEVFELVFKINQERKTSIVIVEHNVKTLLQYVHQVYVLDKGSVAGKGKPQEILDSGVLERVFVGKK